MSTYIGGQHFSDGTYTVDNNKINYTLTAPNGSVSSDSWGVELGYESIIITSSNGNEGTFNKQ